MPSSLADNILPAREAQSAVPLRVLRIGGLLLLLVTAVSYGTWLERSPIYLYDAEVQFALHARSIAATLHDSNGRFLPLYFQMPAIGANVWFQPAIVYFSAPFLRLFPFSEWSVRLPSVVVGLIDVVLMYFVARRMFHREWLAILAAGLLALTPAHFLHSRVAMDYLYPVPFILGWLWALLAFDQDEKEWQIFAAGLILGLGLYSYLASVVMMPFYLVLTWIVLFDRARRFTRAHGLALIGFGLPILLVLPWLIRHPMIYEQTVVRYGMYNAARLTPLQGVKEVLNYNNVQERLSLYWDFYNPAYLFFAGGSNLINSTRRAGVFLAPMALFLVAGLYELGSRARTRIGWLVLAGFLSAPLAALLVDERYAVDRELGLLPFGVIVAVVGITSLVAARRPLVRWAAWGSLLLMPVLFAVFCVDYFTDYRRRSAAAFELNLRQAATDLITLSGPAANPAPVYLSRAIPYAREYWQFYLAKAHREDLLASTHALETIDDLVLLPPRSLILALAIDESAQQHARTGILKIRRIVREPDGAPSFLIGER